MVNKKVMKILGGSILVITIVALLSITYATYTQTLSIAGSGTVKSASWNVAFSNVAGEHTGEGNPGTIGTTSGTSITNLKATLAKPGDTVTYVMTVKNSGTFGAKLTSASKTEINCGTQSVFCKHITVKLTDSKGTEINAPTTSSLLAANGGTETLKLTITYDANTPSNELPSEPVTVSGIGATLTYTQQ